MDEEDSSVNENDKKQELNKKEKTEIKNQKLSFS